MTTTSKCVVHVTSYWQLAHGVKQMWSISGPRQVVKSTGTKSPAPLLGSVSRGIPGSPMDSYPTSLGSVTKPEGSILSNGQFFFTC